MESDLEYLRTLLPAKISALSIDEQNAYLQTVLDRFEEEEQNEQNMKLQGIQFEEAIRSVVRKSPQIYTLSPSLIDTRLLDAIRSGCPSDAVTHIAPGLCALPLFTPDFCEAMLTEVEQTERWAQREGVPIPRPNSMNNHGVVLNHLGFHDFMDALVKEYIAPLARHLFPEIGGDSLDSHHGFVVEYEMGAGGDRSLGLHVDDSEVTLNVCLGRAFQGGDLVFGGQRCDQHQNSDVAAGEAVRVRHETGMALLHAGRMRHEALPISEGFRSNLILWCRSSAFRREADYRVCPSWCGMHDKSRGCGE